MWRASHAHGDTLFAVWRYDSSCTEALWILARPESIHRHLKNCNLQPHTVKERAVQVMLDKGLLRSPSRSRVHYRSESFNNSPAYPGSSAVLHPHSSGPSQLPLPGYSPSLPFPSHSPASSSSALSINIPPSSQTPSPLLFLGSNMISYSPQTTSPLAFPQESTSLSVSSTAGDYSWKRPRISSQGLSRRPSLQHVAWSPDQQARLGVRIARITASCGFPYRWVENPEWIAFLNEFLPAAQTVSRRQISDTLIPMETARYREAAKKRSAGALVTLQCDGWSGINFHHFLAFMITTDRREVSKFFLKHLLQY